MNQFLIQPATIKDVPHLLTILETYTEIFDYQQKRDIIQLANRLLEDQSQPAPIFAVKDQDRLIAFLGCAPLEEDPTQFHLFCQVTKRDLQKQGHGSHMLDHLLTTLQQQNAAAVTLRLRASYPPHTQHFYQHHGFKPRFDENYTGASDEDTIYVKEL